MKKYNENRELFKKVAKESVEGRAKVEEIRSQKIKIDEKFEEVMSAILCFGMTSTLGIAILNGYLDAQGGWKYLWSALCGAVAVFCAVAGKGSLEENKKRKEDLNKLIDTVVEEENKKATL